MLNTLRDTRYAIRFGICILGFGVLLSACAGLGPPLTLTPLPAPTPMATPATPDPEGTARTFLDAWQNRDYAGMYSLLSPLSQDAISLSDFQARYETVARTATLTRLEAQILSVLKNGASAQVLYSVIFHTAVVGDVPPRQIEMPLIYLPASSGAVSEGRWAISWSDGLILPELAGGNLLVLEKSTPARANIYDRNGAGIAVQGDAVAIGVIPSQLTDEESLITTLADLLNLRPDLIRQKIRVAQPDWYVPLGEASAEDVQASREVLASLGGLQLKQYNTRFYPFGGVAAQVVGYMQTIPAEQLAEYQARGYDGDERVGLTGLERWGEEYLTGGRAGKLYVVTPGGQYVTGLAESQRRPAQAIYTTLDRDLQLAAQQALGDFKGSVIVLNPQMGEVLAMASNPAFDPNLFDPTNRNSTALSEVLNDPGRPLLNRAAQGAYPPGSVFKIAMMGAALLSGLYTRDSLYTCTGYWDGLGPNAIKQDWTVTFGVKPHGQINLIQSLAFSCDPYYYTIALSLYQHHPDYMSNIARQFGLGAPTGIGEIDEAAALIPDPAWKLATYGEPWTSGDSVNMGIGQGYVLATPLQIAQMMAAVRNGGVLYRPQLVHHIAPPGGAPTFELQPVANGQLPVKAEHLAEIQEGLRGVTTLPGGTARFVFPSFEVPVAGKTGTAEDPAQGAPHAWFAGYTEANRPDKPDLVIVVMVENKGEGSEIAAPIFKRMVEIYFLGRPYSLYPWESEFGADETPTPAPTP